jgi:hypothetical protein
MVLFASGVTVVVGIDRSVRAGIVANTAGNVADFVSLAEHETLVAEIAGKECEHEPVGSV